MSSNNRWRLFALPREVGGEGFGRRACKKKKVCAKKKPAKKGKGKKKKQAKHG